MIQLMCSRCLCSIGWMNESGPYGFVYCDSCKEEEDKEEVYEEDEEDEES